MLELLREYALNNGLEIEPGFNDKDVRWAILLESNKGFLGIQELGNAGQKKNPGMNFPKCPDLSQKELIAGGETRSHFLVDTAEVVALLGADNADAKICKKHDYFLWLLTEAGEKMPELLDVVRLLQDDKVLEAVRKDMELYKIKATERVALMLNNKHLVNSSAWHNWWRDYRRKLSGEFKIEDSTTLKMRCFVTGALVSPIPTHNKINKLADVGGQPSGDALVCFDKEAFRSYGLEQSANAAVSEEAMSAYRAGLNHLIKRSSQRLAGTKVVHWFKEQVADRDDPMAWLNGIEGVTDQTEHIAQHRAKELLESINTGKRVDLANNRYYALTLCGQAGRVMVRDWMTGDFKELVENVNSWFSDIEVTNLYGIKTADSPGIERVITCLLPPRKPNQKYGDWIKPIGSERISLWNSAAQQTPIPYCVIPRLVVLNRDFILSGDLDGLLKRESETGAVGLLLSMLYARMGLIKAYHIRKNRKDGNNNMDDTLKPGLNETYTSKAYHCGRLMAVLAEVQRSALGDVGAGLIQRYYAAASTTPALVLGRLTRNSQFHLDKLSQAERARWIDQIAVVYNRISPPIPTALSLEEQSLFALGYYHQLVAPAKEEK